MFKNDTSGSGSGIGSAVSGVIKAATTKRPTATRRSAPRYSATSRRASRSNSSNYGGYDSGGGSGNFGGGGSGGGSFGGSSGPAPLKSPSIGDYLGTDSVYQQAVRGGKRSLSDFLSEIGRREGEAGTQYTQTTENMERDRMQQLADMREEFASRGLIQSGLYGEEQGKFQTQFMTQLNALKQQQAALLADLLSQKTNYQRENDLALESAKQEALARRAAKYNIGA